MSGTIAVHQCLFCPQTFDSAVEKDDHILEHFAQETCTDCDQSLIRIGSNLYTLHNAVTCIKRESKSNVSILNQSHRGSLNQNHDEGGCNATFASPEAICDQQLDIKLEPETEQYEQLMTVDPINFTESIYQNSDRDLSAIGVTPSKTLTVDQVEIKMESQVELFISEDVNNLADINDMDFDSSQMFQSESPFEKLSEPKSESNSKEHKCDFCEKSFPNPLQLGQHRKYTHTITNPDRLKCEICKTTFKRKEYLDKHIKFKHTDRIKYTCKFCWAVYMTQNSLDNHHRFCRKRCKKLGIKSQIRDNFNEVEPKVEEMTSVAAEDFTGTSQVFQSQSATVSVKSPKSKGPIECDDCGKVFQGASKLKQHKIYNHTAPGRFECVECNRIFLREPSLRKHMRLKHSGTINACHFCSAQFVLKKSLDDHLTRCKLRSKYDEEDNDMDGSRTCDICEKILASPKAQGLTNHGPKCSKLSKITFECFLCHKFFNSRKYLVLHLRMEHGNGSGRKVRCEICEKYFPYKSSLDSHMNRIHLKLAGQNYVCSICGKILVSKRDLKFHEFTHTGEKPLKCTYEGCDRYFGYHNTRNDHIRCVHKGEKRYQCKFDGCNARFGGIIGFKKHKLNEHGIPMKK
ncbi:zinc finger protein 83-like isoform X2 [Sitodiplosis mosellana]|uniref:zinc finger protein 83-like isoform X2 n=1 Tax=Sitodiplosis mosellana TaxID=263140 RepID=UPI00244485A7|nr:zinc finger protein 83-like isoform X2 [Sitodiplosis mosellana]